MLRHFVQARPLFERYALSAMRHAEPKVPVRRITESSRHRIRLLLAVCGHALEHLHQALGQQPLERVRLPGQADDRGMAGANANEAAEPHGAAKDRTRFIHDLAHGVVAVQAAIDELLHRVARRRSNGDGLEEVQRHRCDARRLPDETVRSAFSRTAYMQKCCGYAMLRAGMAHTNARQPRVPAQPSPWWPPLSPGND